MDVEKIAQKLRATREKLDLSQQQVADELGLSRTAITQLEGGNRSISTTEISKLSKLYNVPIASLLSLEQQEEDVTVALYRSEPSLQQSEASAQVDRCLYLCREGISLRKVLNYKNANVLPSYAVATPTNNGDAIAQGEQIAEIERKRLDLGSNPIRDIQEVISCQGIWSSAIDLPNDMSGLFLHDSSVGLAVFINANHTKGRRRFSYAHEYAHALLDKNHKATVSKQGNYINQIETRANAFAATFLMPQEGIDKLLATLNKGKPSRTEQDLYSVAMDSGVTAEIRSTPHSQDITSSDVAIVASHFGVSYLAALYRLKSLRHITAIQSTALKSQENDGRRFLKLLNLPDQDEDDPETSNEINSQIAYLLVEAYRQEEISKGKLLEVSKRINISGDSLLEAAESIMSA